MRQLIERLELYEGAGEGKDKPLAGWTTDGTGYYKKGKRGKYIVRRQGAQRKVQWAAIYNSKKADPDGEPWQRNGQIGANGSAEPTSVSHKTATAAMEAADKHAKKMK